MIAICIVRVFVVLPKKVLAMVTRTRRMMSRMSLRRTRRQLLRNAVVAISTGLLYYDNDYDNDNKNNNNNDTYYSYSDYDY